MQLKEAEGDPLALEAATRTAASGSRSAEGHRRRPRWRHSTAKLLKAIRFTASLRGGASKMQKVLSQALGLVAPPVLVGPLQRGLESGSSCTVPSAATVSRNEFALDMALNVQKKREYSKDMARWLWSDSSPQCGYDWLWAQVHELKRADLVLVFNAFVKLVHSTRACVDSFDPDDPVDDVVPGYTPLPEWEPLLKQLLRIREHIFTPGAMAAGCTDLPHKVETLLHMFHFVIPSGRPFREYLDTFFSATADLGVEMSFPDFEVEDPEEMAAPWLNRAPLRAGDVDEPIVADHSAERGARL